MCHTFNLSFNFFFLFITANFLCSLPILTINSPSSNLLGAFNLVSHILIYSILFLHLQHCEKYIEQLNAKVSKICLLVVLGGATTAHDAFFWSNFKCF